MTKKVPPTPPVVRVSLPAQLTHQIRIASPIRAIISPIIMLQILGLAYTNIINKNGMGV